MGIITKDINSIIVNTITVGLVYTIYKVFSKKSNIFNLKFKGRLFLSPEEIYVLDQMISEYHNKGIFYFYENYSRLNKNNEEDLIRKNGINKLKLKGIVRDAHDVSTSKSVIIDWIKIMEYIQYDLPNTKYKIPHFANKILNDSKIGIRYNIYKLANYYNTDIDCIFNEVEFLVSRNCASFCDRDTKIFLFENNRIK